MGTRKSAGSDQAMNPEFKLLLLFCLAGIFALGLPWLAWRRVKSLEKKYGRILLVRGVTGAQAARIVLLRGEVPQVDVDESDIAITDFYSAFEPAIKLSSRVYSGKRLFDVARAARLAGHALQHRDRKLGGLASWDSFMIFWGNAWPILLPLTVIISKGRPPSPSCTSSSIRTSRTPRDADGANWTAPSCSTGTPTKRSTPRSWPQGWTIWPCPTRKRG